MSDTTPTGPGTWYALLSWGSHPGGAVRPEVERGMEKIELDAKTRSDALKAARRLCASVASEHGGFITLDGVEYPYAKVVYAEEVDQRAALDVTGPRINTFLTPSIPQGWKIEEHRHDGEIVFDPSKVILYLHPAQKARMITGHDLQKHLAGKPVLNACVLDYLLDHPDLIPEEWKRDDQGCIRYIFFWGTVYSNAGNSPCVRCIYWINEQWHWSFDWLRNPWDDKNPAALLER